MKTAEKVIRLEGMAWGLRLAKTLLKDRGTDNVSVVGMAYQFDHEIERIMRDLLRLKGESGL